MSIIDFVSPASRVFILIAILVAIEWLIPFRPASKNWRRWGVNVGLTLCTIVIFTACFFVIALGVEVVINNGWGLLQLFGLPAALTLVVSIVVLDGATYVTHVLLHKVPALWSLHRIHHADTMVDATTSFRQHPLEALVRLAFLAVTSIAFGIPLVAIAIYRLASSLNALLEHANIYTPLGFDKVISLLWVSPRMHKVHHSDRPSETDSNYGNLFSLFDRLGGTFTSVASASSVNYGLVDPVRLASDAPPQPGAGDPRAPWL